MKPTVPLTDWDEVRQPLIEAAHAAQLAEFDAEDRALQERAEQRAREVRVSGERLEAYSLHPSWTWRHA